MGITKLSKSGFKSSSYEKYNDFLAGNTAFSPSSYESIATVTVGSGGTTSVDFNSISSDYTHLQIRGIFKITATGAQGDLEDIRMRFNGDTGANYTLHRLYGGGVSAGADASTSQTTSIWGNTAINSTGDASKYAVGIIDILDYKNTNKNKTIKVLNGVDLNPGGRIMFNSSAWLSTSAITDIKIYPPSTFSFVQYSQFALYGIKN